MDLELEKKFKRLDQMLNGKYEPFLLAYEFKLDDLITKIVLIVLSIVVAFLNLGIKWYEILIKILAFLIVWGAAMGIYKYTTDYLFDKNPRFRRVYNILLVLIFPVLLYIGVKIFFL